MTVKHKEYDFEKALHDIINKVKRYYPAFSQEDARIIENAFHFGQKAHEDQKRFSGEPYFIHPVEAVKILLSIRPDIETIVACLLHDVIEDTDISAQTVEEKFGADVRFLCEGVEKVSKVNLKKDDKTQKKYENLQKLFVAVAKDIRVIFIKLADRIHNLKTLNHVRKEKQERIATESLQIYSHVAGKLGLFEFKVEIQDLCFRYLHSEAYTKIKAEIAVSKKERQAVIEMAKKQIISLFTEEQFDYLDIHGRQKNLYSAYEKIKRKNLSSAIEIYDLFGIRVIVKTKNDCYRALGILHSHWKPMPNRFKDYISVPKPNGYQSLHTTVLGLGNSRTPMEVQIRTRKMHLDAEFGPAAHWAYKETNHSHFDEDYIARTSWFPQNIPYDSQENPEQFFEKMANAILEHRIYVFTPKGEIKTLPAGSTPIDFAYNIHTEVGGSCIGARVNGIIKPLNYQLKNGEVVEIMTKQGRTPNPLWLKFVQSSQAKNHIQSHINKTKNQAVREILEKEEEKKEITKTDKERLVKKTKSPVKKNTQPKETIIIGGESDMPYKFAACCHPLPGKDIIAYKSRGLECTIHEANCDELNNLEPERFLEAYFQVKKSFLIKAHDRVGLLKDYTNIISGYGLNIIGSKMDFNERTRVAEWYFKVECRSNQEYHNLAHELEKITNVLLVKEVDSL